VIARELPPPPWLRILNSGEHQPRFNRIENVFVEHAGDDRSRTADVQIEMADSGFEFVRHAPHSRAAPRRENFDFNAIAFFEVILDLFSHLSAGRNRYRYFAFLLRGINQKIPCGGSGDLAGLAVSRGRAYQAPEQTHRQTTSRDHDLDRHAFLVTRDAN